MKKITYYFSMIFMAVMMLSLTSCDEDADIAYALNGTWEGIMQTQLDYDGRYYQSNMSEVTFNSGYDSGDGYWIDYNRCSRSVRNPAPSKKPTISYTFPSASASDLPRYKKPPHSAWHGMPASNACQTDARID